MIAIQKCHSIKQTWEGLVTLKINFSAHHNALKLKGKKVQFQMYLQLVSKAKIPKPIFENFSSLRLAT